MCFCLDGTVATVLCESYNLQSILLFKMSFCLIIIINNEYD